MKNIKPLAIALLFLLFFAGCKVDNLDISGNAQPVPDCQQFHTARVQFKNRSSSNKKLTVIWDGSVKAVLSPGYDSQFFTEAAGRHTLTFKVSSTGAIGCTQSTPVLIECYDHAYTCNY